MRKDWTDYFLEIADTVSTRGSCDRLQVGAVLVSPEMRIVSTGYNGAPAGHRHCRHTGSGPFYYEEDKRFFRPGQQFEKDLRDNHCALSIHAETNALLEAGIQRAKDCILYVTHCPCYECAKLIATCKIQTVYYTHEYGNVEEAKTFLANADIYCFGRSNANSQSTYGGLCTK